jgi:hypothetical protein
MSDWNGMARSNYFRVKDKEEFAAWIKSLGLNLIEKDDRVGFYADEGPGLPSSIVYDEDDMTPDEFLAWEAKGKPEDEDVDVLKALAGFLAPNSCAVVVEAGSQKARYVSGWSAAVTDAGVIANIHIADIYKQVEAHNPELDCTVAEY